MKKRIMFIIDQYGDGGVARVLENLSLNLSGQHYEQILVILMKNKSVNFQYKAKLMKLVSISENPLLKLINFLTILIKLFRIKHDMNYEVYTSFGTLPNIMNILTGKHSRCVLTEHSIKSIENSMWGIRGKVFNLIMRWFYKLAGQIVVVSEPIKYDLIENYGISYEKISVIYNGVNLESINKYKNEEIEDEYIDMFSGPTIINVGSLVYAKAQWHLVRIMPALLKSIPNLQLIIIGEGPFFHTLVDISHKLCISNHVHLLGRKSNPYKFVSKASLFVLTSLYEGFSYAIIEAMALGVPIISTACKYGPLILLSKEQKEYTVLKDIESTDYGILTPVFDGKVCNDEGLNFEELKLVEAILKLFDDKEAQEYYSFVARERANDFSVDLMIKEYIKIFEKVINNN